MDLNSKWYHLMLEIANKAAKIPGVKWLLKPFYYPIKKRVERSQREKFLQNGLQVLQRFDRCMEDNGIEYTLAYGTLLGAVREKGFIKHDFDIDVYVWGSQYSDKMVSALKAEGFELIHDFKVEDGSIGREETYKCEGVAIDIFYVYDDGGKYPYCCDFTTIDGIPTFNQCMQKYGVIHARKTELPITRERVQVPFESILLYIPENAKEILEFLYGENYMTPDPNYDANTPNEHIRIWTEKSAYYREM